MVSAKQLIAASLAGYMLLHTCGCSAFPAVRHREKVHNPFPQLKQVAILPFYNQSNVPTVNGEEVALAYYAELQSVPGFEVLPVGVSRSLTLQYAQQHGEPTTGEQFQQLAQFMGVEAVVVGSVTDFDAYYPPRMAMTVHWYAANPGFHPVPPGYGLPWGTKEEKRIPQRIVQEAEFELAREQLLTQTPVAGDSSQSATGEADGGAIEGGQGDLLPASWPDPTGFIPDAPSPSRPPLVEQTRPIITHTRIYRGNDAYVTDKLADYVNNGDEARAGGWQNYLNRSNDFIRFCCHLHIDEMLESRGGRDQSDLILRWPISRYKAW